MSVVRRATRRRWATVLAGVTALCLAPAGIAALPTSAPDVHAELLRDQVTGSAILPYQGIAQSEGDVRLPSLEEFGDVTGLFGGGTTMRAWYASPDAWRVAVVTPTGERDTYRAGSDTYIWDFERNLMTQVVGALPVRLPWAVDVLPPDLARRLLASTEPDDPVTSLPARKVAGLTAAGLRLTPSDQTTTIGHIDIWADPASGLPVHVDVAARGSDGALFTTRFLELDQRPPSPSTITPVQPDSAGFAFTQAPDLAATLNVMAWYALPNAVAGRRRVDAPLEPQVARVAAYGDGLSTFVVLPLPGRLGRRALDAIESAGGTPIPVDGGRAFELRTSLLSTVIARTDGPRGTRRGYLIAGLVSPEILRQAGAELLEDRP